MHPTPSVIAFTRYCESLWSVTLQGCFNISNPAMAANISIRLLVVFRNPPLASARFLGCTNTTPYPPGPGFGSHPPSV